MPIQRGFVVVVVFVFLSCLFVCFVFCLFFVLFCFVVVFFFRFQCTHGNAKRKGTM